MSALKGRANNINSICIFGVQGLLIHLLWSLNNFEVGRRFLGISEARSNPVCVILIPILTTHA